LPLGGRLVKHARYYWLLLAAGVEPPDSAAVGKHAAKDRGATVTGGIGKPGLRANLRYG